MTDPTMKRAECDQRHANVDEHYRDMRKELEGMRADVRRVVIGICGDVEQKTPGLIVRMNSLELRMKIVIGLLSSTVLLTLVGMAVRYIFS